MPLPSFRGAAGAQTVRPRTLVDLLAYPLDVAEVQATYQELLAHAGTRELLTRAATWGEQPLRRHNDAGHICR